MLTKNIEIKSKGIFLQKYEGNQKFVITARYYNGGSNIIVEGILETKSVSSAKIQAKLILTDNISDYNITSITISLYYRSDYCTNGKPPMMLADRLVLTQEKAYRYKRYKRKDYEKLL